jgi:hypothetical protein
MTANEAKPERSINLGPGPAGDEASALVAYQMIQGIGPGSQRSSQHNWTVDDTNSWTSEFNELPPGVPPEVSVLEVVGGDPWSATHGGTGLEYIGYIGQYDGGFTWCAAVAATDRASMVAGSWFGDGLFCLPPLPLGMQRFDGPMIFTDLGAQAFYSSYVVVPPNAPVLRRYAPCTGGIPGQAGCPFDWEAGALGSNTDHSNGIVNPCTHHPINLARTASQIRASVHDITTGQVISNDTVLVDGVPWENNSTCACSDGEVCKCGAGTDDCGAAADVCHDVAYRVHAATTFDDGQCTLYVAYDESYEANGETYMRAVLRGFDVTGDNELDPAAHPVLVQKSASETDVHNDFEAVVVTDFFSSNVGLFFYRQEGANACNTTFRGAVSTDGVIFTDYVLSGPFPTLIAGFTTGLEHYVAGAHFTKPGSLYVSWAEPVPLDAPIACIPCQSQEHSLAIMGAELFPG